MNQLFLDPEWSTLKKLLFLKAAGQKLVEYTATGNPMQFETNVAKPLKSLLIPFTPKQASGTPSPTNVLPITGFTGVTAYRTGANLWNEDYTGISSDLKYVQIYVGNTKVTMSTTLVRDNETGASLFLLPGYATSGATTDTNGVDANYNVKRTFEAVNGYVTVAYRIWNSKDPRTAHTMLNIGETALPYEPYTGEVFRVTFPAFGKNLFDEVYPDLSDTTQYRAIYVGDNTVTMSTTAVRYGGTASPLFLIPGNVSAGASSSSNGVWDGQDRTVTAEDGYVTIGYRYNTKGDNVNPSKNHTMLNVGSSSIPYEPYTNTAYGGSLDMTTGLLTVTHKLIKLVGQPTGISSTYAGSFYYNVTWFTNDADMTKPFLCDRLQYVGNSTENFAFGTCINNNNQSFNLWVKDTAFASKEEVATWLSNNETNICISIANPVSYQLTPQQIATLANQQNIIWTDTNGSNTAVYFKKG